LQQINHLQQKLL